jgi:uncharacterized protein YndB with AHSA1/START domain
MKKQIIVSALIDKEVKQVWDSYTNPKHIIHWNFADPSWHCPNAVNDLRIGGKYIARMEARDGSFGFDFECTYTNIIEGEEFSYDFGDRKARVQFKNLDKQTEITVSFDPEDENSLELQQNGWQAILNNFKKYTETNL